MTDLSQQIDRAIEIVKKSSLSEGDRKMLFERIPLLSPDALDVFIYSVEDDPECISLIANKARRQMDAPVKEEQVEKDYAEVLAALNEFDQTTA